MKKLALSTMYTKDSIRIAEAVRKRTDLSSSRFDRWNVPEHDREQVVAVYGEDVFTDIVARQCNFSLIRPTNDWLVHVPLNYLKRKIEFTTVETIYNDQIRQFIKCVDFKFFKAGVYNNIQEVSGIEDLEASTELFTSEIVQWRFEVRCFVYQRTIKTYSNYAVNGIFDTTYEMIGRELNEFQQFTTEFLENRSISIPEAIVLDFGIIEGKGWALIEANPAWSSGIYECDPDKALDVILNSCIDKIDHGS